MTAEQHAVHRTHAIARELGYSHLDSRPAEDIDPPLPLGERVVLWVGIAICVGMLVLLAWERIA